MTTFVPDVHFSLEHGDKEPELSIDASAAPRVVIVHDYLTQRGGAERVVLALMRAFPNARLVTSLYHPEATYPEFQQFDIETLPINRWAPLRQNHKLALPFLARAFQSKRITDCDAVLCSSSGWAHGISTDAPKIVYSHNPPRWLYQSEDYFRGQPAFARWVLRLLRRRLENWDKKSAAEADTYLVNSSAVAGRVLQTYGRRAEVLHPPVSIQANAERVSVDGVAPGFFLCIARSRGYKHVDIVAEAAVLAGVSLVVVGTSDGPCADLGVAYLGTVTDAELRWLYENAAYLVGAAHEDFGLTPIEANSFGTPALVLRSGGYLETVREGVNGLFFDELTVECLSEAMQKASARQLAQSDVLAVADEFSEGRFGKALRERVMAVVR